MKLLLLEIHERLIDFEVVSEIGEHGCAYLIDTPIVTNGECGQRIGRAYCCRECRGWATGGWAGAGAWEGQTLSDDGGDNLGGPLNTSMRVCPPSFL